MDPRRFEFALERLGPGAWERFEALAGTFLAEEFVDLRTVASPSGDRGRDAFLLQPVDDDQFLLQYSVQTDWEDKIRATVRRVKKTFPGVTSLVYVTNQVIGASGDPLRIECRKEHRLYLDYRDRSWFTLQVNTTPQREAAAEQLAAEIVDPILEAGKLIRRNARSLTSDEAQAALVHLELQWADESREKNLTRVCFEAVVRAALRHTSSENRATRNDVYAAVQSILPGRDPQEVARHTATALKNLTKRYIRHYRKEDEFCLTFEERKRIEGRLIDMAILDDDLNKELGSIVEANGQKLQEDVGGTPALVERVRRVLEQVLLERGESFAASVSAGRAAQMTLQDVEGAVLRDAVDHPLAKGMSGSTLIVVGATLQDVLTAPSTSIQNHLRGMADAYTMFAFLRETPDIQKALVKIFTQGELWLDASIILPLLADSLVEAEQQRLTHLVGAARECDLQLYVTDGTIREVLSHLRLCWRYPQEGTAWRSKVPFLYSAFVMSGRMSADLGKWLDGFRGYIRPEDDLTAYLRDCHSIRVRNLDAEASRSPEPLKTWATRQWRNAHERRRSGDLLAEPAVVEQLIDDDIETYLGVIQRRNQSKDSPFGFSTWLLTLDGAALRLTPPKPCLSPAMSPDFLTNYFALGPIRRRLRLGTAAHLPLLSDMTNLELLPPEVLDEAEKVRQEFGWMPERLVQRRIRDTLDGAKLRRGVMAKGGLDGIKEQLRVALEGRVGVGAPAGRRFPEA